MRSKQLYLLRLLLCLSDFIANNIPFLVVNLITPLQLHDSNKWFTFSALLVFNASWLLFSGLFSLYTKDTLSVTEKMLRFTFRTLLAHT
ncbi:MAG: hypothetical protein M3R72_09890, partial [Bacteroidota bacterium]|nr:hypothetical protein [Bacteroidota bacterium]